MKKITAIIHLNRLCLYILLTIICFKTYSQEDQGRLTTSMYNTALSDSLKESHLKYQKIKHIIFIKEFECYIDLDKIVEISALKQMPFLSESKPGIYPSGYFENLYNSEAYKKQGQFYFTITYQLKTPVKHWINRSKIDSENIYNNFILIYKNFK